MWACGTEIEWYDWPSHVDDTLSGNVYRPAG